MFNSRDLQSFVKEVLNNSCNMGTCGLADMYTFSPQVNISDRPPMPMLKLLIVHTKMACTQTHFKFGGLENRNCQIVSKDT